MWRPAFAAMVLLGCASSTVLLGCASSTGDALMRQRSFVEAEAAYDRDLAAAPGDRELKQKRDAARFEAMRAKLEQARSVRTSGHGQAALPLLAEALALETRWKLAVPADLAAVRDAEIAAAGDAVAAVMRRELAARTPLAAGKRIEKLLSLFVHPRLVAVRDKIMADIAAVGKARCGALAASDGARTPYLARLAAGYCRPYGVEIAAPAAPEQRRGLRVTGRVESTSDVHHRAIESWVASAFQESAWFAPEATAAAPLALSGQYDAKLERKQVTLTAPYRNVETTTVRRYYMNTGIKLETESERVFPYLAEQYDARYHLDATLTLQLTDGAPPFVIRVNWQQKRRAYEHDVSFPKAGVHPQKANLPSVSAWLSQRLAGKRYALVKKLQARWAKTYCAAARFEIEDAARCLSGSGERIPRAVAALETVFGEDAPLLLERAARGAPPPPDEKPDPKDATEKPESPTIEENTPGSVESI
jgi:hypothetical protein